jgi:hypothetical protein
MPRWQPGNQNRYQGVALGEEGPVVHTHRIYLAGTALAAALAACSTAPAATSDHTAPAAPVAVSSPASSPATPSCRDGFDAWKNAGGVTPLTAVGGDIGTVGTTLLAVGTDIRNGVTSQADQQAATNAAVKLSGDVKTAQADLPPDCIPGVRTAESAGLGNYATAATNTELCMTALQNGDDSLAATYLAAANTAMTTGSSDIKTAIDALNAWNGS